MGYRLSTFVVLLFASLCAGAEDAVVIEAALGKVASGVRLDPAVLWVDGKMRGVLPTAIQMEMPSEARLSVSGGSFGFNALLKRTNDGFTIESRAGNSPLHSL